MSAGRSVGLLVGNKNKMWAFSRYFAPAHRSATGGKCMRPCFLWWYFVQCWLICFANDVTADFMSTVFIVTRIVTEEVPIALKYRGAAAPKQWFEPHGIWASRLGLSLQAGIWALRPEYGLLDWDMTLKAGIWASRLGYEPWTWALRLVLVPQGWNLSKRLGFEHWR